MRQVWSGAKLQGRSKSMMAASRFKDGQGLYLSGRRQRSGAAARRSGTARQIRKETMKDGMTAKEPGTGKQHPIDQVESSGDRKP